MPLAKRQHEGFRDDPSISNRVICEVCEKFGETSHISRKTITGHLQTLKHKACAHREAADQANKTRLEAQYLGVQAAVLNPGTLGAQAESAPADAWVTFLPNDVNGISSLDYDMPVDLEGNPIYFTAGDDIDLEREQRQYESDLQDFTYKPEYIDMDGQGEDTTLSELVREMEEAGLYEEEDEGDVQARLFGNMRTQEWAPYESKTMALIDLMDNLPRMRLSDAQLRMMLFIMKESGSKDVPSLYALRQIQEKLHKVAGTETLQYKSVLGNVFFANNLCDIIAKDYANPVTARTMSFYPIFVHLVSTSPHASSAEQFEAVSQQIKRTHADPVVTYNAATMRECMFRVVVPCLPGDNPQQSDDCSHIGHNGSYPCRQCYIGGSAQERVTDDRYHALFEAGKMRKVEETRSILNEQLDLAMLGVAAPVNDLETSTGIKDKICRHYINDLLAQAKALHKEGVSESEATHQLCRWLDEQPGEHRNPLLAIPGLDPHQDTPVEILHTVLLGIVKYAWHGMWSAWPDKGSQFDTFTLRLQSTNLDGLRVPPIRAAYMQQYKNGLIGKHFKTIMQTAIFHLHGLVSPKVFALWKAIGELGPLLWISQIKDLAQYLSDLTILIDNVLEAFTAVDPTRILQKIKIHILTHLPADIARFGPAVRFATEVFECYNAIFRMCSVLSNHQAPSRDIGIKCSHMDRVKHILSGGFWKDGADWVQALPDVLGLLASKRCIQAHLGWVPHVDLEIGSISQPPVKERECLPWEQTRASRVSLPNGSCIHATSQWHVGATIIAANQDKCRLRSWVVFRSYDGALLIGRIEELVFCADRSVSPRGLVLIEPFQLSSELHVDFHMPVLTRCVPMSSILVSNMDIQFCINVQHDCRTAQCEAGDGPAVRQERQDTQHLSRVIIHKNDDQFIINTHALHNAARLREVLPRTLTAPCRLVENPRALHDTLAADLRITQTTRRAEINAKTQQTREANKRKKKEAGTAGHQPGVREEQAHLSPGPTPALAASAAGDGSTSHSTSRKRSRTD